MSKELPLTRGQVTIVDDENYEWLARHKWQARKDYNTFYAVRNMRTATGWRTLLMHREILNPPEGLQTDHIDGNGLNNQRANLRICTKAQNQQNRRPQPGSSRFKGVGWRKDIRKWGAKIQNAGKQIALGYFIDETDAARAYDQAALKLFGAFARANFPHEKGTTS